MQGGAAMPSVADGSVIAPRIAEALRSIDEGLAAYRVSRDVTPGGTMIVEGAAQHVRTGQDLAEHWSIPGATIGAAELSTLGKSLRQAAFGIDIVLPGA